MLLDNCLPVKIDCTHKFKHHRCDTIRGCLINVLNLQCGHRAVRRGRTVVFKMGLLFWFITVGLPGRSHFTNYTHPGPHTNLLLRNKILCLPFGSCSSKVRRAWPVSTRGFDIHLGEDVSELRAQSSVRRVCKARHDQSKRPCTQ